MIYAGKPSAVNAQIPVLNQFYWSFHNDGFANMTYSANTVAPTTAPRFSLKHVIVPSTKAALSQQQDEAMPAVFAVVHISTAALTSKIDGTAWVNGNTIGPLLETIVKADSFGKFTTLQWQAGEVAQQRDEGFFNILVQVSFSQFSAERLDPIAVMPTLRKL